jgi:predicted dehydrogenase
MIRTIGVGVIGMGWMGEVHSRSYREIRDRFYDSGLCPRLIACSDNIPDRAAAAQERFGFEQHTTNWQDVIANPEIEAVNITTPNGLHLEMVRAAAAAPLMHILSNHPEISLGANRNASVLLNIGHPCHI